MTAEAVHTKIAWTPDAPGLLLAAHLSVFLGISRRAERSTTAQRAETPRLGALNPVRHRRAHIEEL